MLRLSFCEVIAILIASKAEGGGLIMTNKVNTRDIAEVLFNAYETGEAISKVNIQEVNEKSTAYGIQQRVTSKKATLNKDPHIGYKISLTSEETQKLFSSETPLYGAFTASNIVEETIELDKMISPLIELELVFIVKEELSTKDSLESILQKTRVSPGLEIPDSRFKDWFPKLSLYQVIADSAVAGKIVIGKSSVQLSLNQLKNIKGTLKFNGETIASGSSEEVLGSPVNAVKWLIDELALHGHTLKKGAIISSGTFILPKILEVGKYKAEFEGIGEVVLNIV